MTQDTAASKDMAPRPLKYDDPLVIGVGALVIGFALGSGRWNWLGKGMVRIAESMGSLALTVFSQSLQERNPQVFVEGSRLVH